MGCCGSSEDTSNYSDLQLLCKDLRDSLTRMNTDEEEVIAIMTGNRRREAIGEKELRTWIQEDLVPTYNNMYGGSMGGNLLEKDIKDGCGGKLEDALLNLIRPDAENLASMLREAMKGFGTDEFALTSLCCTLPVDFLAIVHETYRNMYEGRELIKDIESEISGDFKKVLMLNAGATRGEAYAQVCHAAMKGLGTDERSLIRILTTATFEDIKAMNEAFMMPRDGRDGRTLQTAIGDDTSGSFKKLLLALSKREHFESSDLQADAEVLRNACEGLGTDEEAIIGVLGNKHEEQIVELCDVYKQKYGEDLRERLKSETTGLFESSDFKECLQALCQPRLVTIAHYLRKAMKGWGTDEWGLIMLLIHRNPAERMQIQNTYNQQFNRDLIKDIRSECSGDFEDALVALIEPIQDTIAKAIYKAMDGWGTSNHTLISMLVASTAIMPEVRSSFEAQYGKTMIGRIRDELRGDYERVLVAIAEYDPPRITVSIPEDM